jgi:hypothetical protein
MKTIKDLEKYISIPPEKGRYRLIQVYPGSPELGEIVYPYVKGYSTRRDKHNKYLEKNIVEGNPEFWEKIDRGTFQILEFKNTKIKDLNLDGGYVWNPNLNIFYKKKDDLEYLIEIYKIKSIKHLYDNEVFSVGDKVEYRSSRNSSELEIEGIRVLNNRMFFTYKGDHASYDDWSSGDLIKKTPLFTTEDGVDIYIGDDYWVYDPTMRKQDRVHRVNNASQTHDGKGLNRTYFSSKEKAEEYRVLNFKGLSIHDVKRVFPMMPSIKLEKLKFLLDENK